MAKSLCLIRFSRPLFFTLLLALIIVPKSVWAQAVVSCENVFREQTAPKSISYYLDQVNSAQERMNNEPRFLDPAEEAALVPLWKGTRQGPRAIRDTLLENTALLDFQLLAADAGAVKLAQPGNFTSLRLNHNWEGKNMSTNIGLPIDAIVARSLMGQKQLVPATAKAVMIFMHGGGTKTTGHHVAAALSNFMAQYGVVVVSMDAPFHAYGPRVANLAPLDYYRYLVSFRHQFIPKNVPTFIGGHSMGGLHADNMMRLSDRKDLGLHEAFAGLVNLSGPMDNAPGLSLREKNNAESEVVGNKELMELVPESERDLSVLLLTQGKSSALSGVSAETFMGLVNWKLPKHKGSQYLPTVAIMGERDALYVGREKIFDEYVTQLENTKVHLMGQRTDFKGREAWVAHMIFDHYRANTQKPETFNLIKDFIDERLGETLEPSGHPLLSDFEGSTVGLVTRLVHEYYNNLAFRRFAHQYYLVEKLGTDKMSEVGETTANLSREARTLQNEIKDLRKQDPERSDIVIMEARLQEIQSEIHVLRSQQQSHFVPEDGGLKAFAQQNVQRRLDLSDLMKDIISEKKTLTQKLNMKRDEKNRLQNTLEKIVQEEFDNETIQNDTLVGYRNNYEQVLNHMIDLQIKMNEANNEMVTSNIEQGRFDINPDAELIKTYRNLDQAYSLYNQSEKHLKKAIERAIAQGELGKKAQAILLELYGSREAHQKGIFTAESVIGRTEILRQKIEQRELTYSRYNSEVNQLLVSYVERVTPDLYRVRMANMIGELDRPLKDLIGNTSTLEKLWKVWVEIWKERPPEQGASLY